MCIDKLVHQPISIHMCILNKTCLYYFKGFVLNGHIVLILFEQALKSLKYDFKDSANTLQPVVFSVLFRPLLKKIN